MSFGSWLATYFHRFVALKRAGGAQYTTQAMSLARFDRFIVEKKQRSPLRRTIVLEYLCSLDHLFARSRENQVSVVWSALAHAQRHGASVELPPRPPAPSASLRKRPPRILTAPEFTRVFAATYKLETTNKFWSATTRTLIGLLFTTGIRIGEARALDVGDLDVANSLLTVRRGKFGKARIIPLRASATAALEEYLKHPARPVAARSTMPIFLSGRGNRIGHAGAAHNLHTACRVAAIATPHPCVHDLRHSFAVLRVAAWYEQGRDVDALLPLLSTYLGHVSVENTRTYLAANGLLLEHAASRFARKIAGLDGAQP
ncbi:MAG: tyrosine-type recombinase/integrase [Rhodoglobus sp.]